MITQAQENTITDYLVSKNLSLDLLVEIREHIIHQILDLQWDENLSFEKAFSKAKESWNGEFKMVNYWLFFPTKLPLIARRIISAKYNRMLKNSLVIGVFSLGINILLMYLLKSEEIYTVIFRILNGLFLLALAASWILNFKIWKYMRTDFKYSGKCFYTLYQKNMGLMISCAVGLSQIVMRSGSDGYNFFRNADYADISMVLSSLPFSFIMQTATVFALFNFYGHKRNLSKMQEFLGSAAD
ncbi:hypothetical protein ACQ7CU_23265 [Chryseobacterium arthrosphaerae]|uniref:hypothetical protein n=1 Tax=Chryseobacterium arthrosphaerae TaxID=651561 RepID=UPI003D34C5DC